MQETPTDIAPEPGWDKKINQLADMLCEVRTEKTLVVVKFFPFILDHLMEEVEKKVKERGVPITKVMLELETQWCTIIFRSSFDF